MGETLNNIQAHDGLQKLENKLVDTGIDIIYSVCYFVKKQINMKIQLGVESNAYTILGAITEASHIEESSTRKWSAREFVGEYVEIADYSIHEHPVIKEVPKSKGLEITPTLLDQKRKYFFIGKKSSEWQEGNNPKFILRPLALDGSHTEITIDFEYIYDVDNYGNEQWTDDMDDSELCHEFKLVLMQILENYFKRRK